MSEPRGATGAPRPLDDDGARPGDQALVAALRRAGEVGTDLLAVDWAATPIGSPDRWPSSLVTAVRILLTSRFSMWMAWGPELTFFCNDAYRRDTLGSKYPWALGRPAREVWAEIWSDIGPRIERVLETGEATWDESLLLFLERSGYVEETYHTFSYSPLTDDAGEITGMLCVVSEDTEQVIGERRMTTLRGLGAEPTTGRDDREYLRAASARLAVDGRSLPFTAIYLFDEDGTAELVASSGIEAGHPAAPARIALGSPAPAWPAERLARGETVVIENLDRRFAALPTGDWPEPPHTAVLLALQRPIRAERPFGFLLVGVNRYRPVDAAYLGFLDLVAAQLASGIASARALEAERRRAEELAELDRAKMAFFTNVSHELRTPLTLLLGPAEDALAEPDLPASVRERMEMIARNGNRLLRLVNALLDFSRLESDAQTPSFEPVDVAGYTAELASMFDSTASRAGLSLQVDCPPLPAPVWVDREMWAKIVLNLLSNALKYTLTGGVTVRVAHDDQHARLVVSDTGIGIDAAELPRLFERFHRVPGAHGRTFEGSGIGLALVAELATLHGGRPGVTSVPGRGSAFTVEIPFGSAHLPPEQRVPGERTTDRRPDTIEREAAGLVAEASRWHRPDADRDGGGTSRARRRGSDPHIPLDSRPPRVLIVDDSRDMRDYLTSVLAERYVVHTATDGEEGLRLALRDPPDLVLTDVMMPRLDGFGLLAALRADPGTLAIPVVMLSARAGEEGVVEGLEAGADDYLVKPFSARELLARVHSNLELDRVRRTRDQLQRSRRMQDQAERLSAVGSWEIDLQSGATRGSLQLLRMLGLDRRAFEALANGDGIVQAVHPDDRDRVRALLNAAVTTRQPFQHELRLAPEGGPDRWIVLGGDVIADERGEPVTLQGFMQDISERRRAERALAVAAAAREAAAREHQIADGLQRRMLPSDTVDSAHLEVGTYYRAGEQGMRVGGDWYDVIDLGAGRIGLMIGDVAGRGVDAAALMGQLRAAVRAYAHLDLPPSELLELVNALVVGLGEGRLVTGIYGIYDPTENELCYANAGHLPPLLAVPGCASARRLSDASSPPLGLPGTRFTDERVSLPVGAIIALYTDGLVERRDQPIDDRIDLLTAQLLPDAESIAELPEALVAALAPNGGEDDIAILVARTRPIAGQRIATLELPGEMTAAGAGRHFTALTLTEWTLPESVVGDAELIASELITNAVLHGRPPIRLQLRVAPGELTIEVDDGSSAMPRRLRAAPEDLHGRGLAIVARLASRWAARPQGFGKTVWSTLTITPPGDHT